MPKKLQKKLIKNFVNKGSICKYENIQKKNVLWIFEEQCQKWTVNKRISHWKRKELFRLCKSIIGIKCIYLYTAGDEHLTDYYERVFNFKKVEDESYIPVALYHDNDCSFMFYVL